MSRLSNICYEHMEYTSSQTIDSDESERKLQVAGCDGHELADDDLSKNVDLCTGEVDKTLEQSIESLPSRDDAIEPYIGMEFKSRDDAREFYTAYGRQTGFTVRIHHNRRSRINNMVISQDYVCSKEGFRCKKYTYRNDRVLPPPPITREGCPAIIRLAFRDGDKWVVTKFIKDHNHELMSPSKVPWRGSTEIPSMPRDKDKKIEVLTLELERHEQLCAAYREKLFNLMNNIEEQTEELSSKIQVIVGNVRKAESEMLKVSHRR